MKWPHHRNLRNRPLTPFKGRGRLQVHIRRAFIASEQRRGVELERDLQLDTFATAANALQETAVTGARFKRSERCVSRSVAAARGRSVTFAPQRENEAK